MSGIKIIHQNKRVGYDYQLLEKVEAGELFSLELRSNLLEWVKPISQKHL